MVEHAAYRPSRQSRITLHTDEAGDPYYIGDIYEKSKVAQLLGSEAEEGRGYYLDYLDALSRNGWPRVRYLADFMRVTTAPPKLRFLTVADRRERASRINVAMLEIHSNGEIQRHNCSSAADLTRLVTKTTGSFDGSITHLYIVEDLSRDVIEILGWALDVHPSFFTGHLSDYMWFNTRDPWVELSDLDIVSRTRPYFHARYVQTRYFRSSRDLERARQEAAGFNVLRRLDRDGNWVPGADIPGSDVGLVRSRMSFWTGARKKGEGVVGILLLDPSIKSGFPIWGGYRQFSNAPSVHAPVEPSPPRTSGFEGTIYWISQLSNQEIRSISRDPRILFRKPLFIVCAEWLTLIRYATTRLTQLEWELENPDLRQEAEGLNITLSKLHSWRRRFPIFKTLVSEILSNVINRHAFASATENNLHDLARDFEILLADLDGLHTRAERIMSVVTAVMSIEESKKAYQHNLSLARITYLAVIFVPLAFVSSLFSMNDDISRLGTTFWIYFAVAIPLTLLALLVTRFSGAVNDGLERAARRYRQHSHQ
ncbi:MAG: hypothetical protein Q9190_000893 [Brigantiaea leucoxantha]